jgi:Carboxypeptidase regulatory-like domain
MSLAPWTFYVHRTAVAAAVATLLIAPALAQNTTSGISGSVIGADGKPVAAATVTIRHEESGTTSVVSTDEQGRYSARGLRAGGPYTLTISKGALTEKRQGLVLALAETLSQDAQLGASTQTIVVTGRGVNEKFASSAMGAGTNLGARELAAYASIQRNLQDYARTDPRLAQTDKERGEISAAGQNTRYNSITIDGVNINDSFGLESNNLPTIKQPISIDAIQSVQVNLSNYDVTQKGYTGANINAVTKSGTNEFKGSVYYVMRDQNLVGQRYNRTTDGYFDAPSFKEDTKGFTLGGPIVKDKLFFFGSYEEFKSSRSSPDFGPLGNAKTNVGISQSSIDSAINIARTTWGMDVGTDTVPTGLAVSVKDALLKVDWNINDDHRASLRYTKTAQVEPVIAGFSATGLSLSSWWWNQEKTVESVVGQWFADWSPTLSSELKVSQRNYDSLPFVVNGSKLPAIGLRFSGALPVGTPAAVNANNRFLNMGTELSRQNNALQTESTDLYLGANWSLGAHELKFGLDYSDNKVLNAFVQNVNGNYTFGCEPGVYSFGDFSTTSAVVANRTGCVAMTAAQRELATLENFRSGKPSAYTLQAPLAGRTVNDAVANWKYGNTGLFVQDTFKPLPKLSLVVGLRMDQQSVPSKPLANTDVAAAAVPGTVVGTTFNRATGGFGRDNTETLDGNQLLQPRVGFNWDLGDKDTRRQVRGGFGLFQGAAANVWLSNPFSNTGKAIASLNCASFTACSTANNGAQLLFNPNPATQPQLVGTIPAANVDLLSPDMQQPSVWKVNLGFETELPALPVVGRTVFGAEWLHTKVQSGVYYEHLNLGAPTRTGSDGRQLFYRAEGFAGGAAATFAGACWNPDGTPITAGACATPAGQARTKALSNARFNNVLLAKETKQGGGDALTLTLSQPATLGLGWSLSYTTTTAKEVNPLTSSTSNSNWSNRNIFNPNEEVAANSNYLVKDRINASLNWSAALIGNHRTSVGVFYEGRKGKPYSWTYLNDLNGDGIGGNDLMYIPSAPGSGEVVFRGRSAAETSAQAETAFWDVVNANGGLSSAKGGLVGRNNNYAPWVNNVDVRLSQEVPGFMKEHKGTITLDILNFGNLLNKKWGRIDEVGFPSNRSFVNYAGLDANGKYIYTMGSVEDLATRQAGGESQWAVQLTLRYSF